MADLAISDAELETVVHKALELPSEEKIRRYADCEAVSYALKLVQEFEQKSPVSWFVARAYLEFALDECAVADAIGAAAARPTGGAVMWFRWQRLKPYWRRFPWSWKVERGDPNTWDWSPWHYRLDLDADAGSYACGLSWEARDGVQEPPSRNTSALDGKVCKRCWAYYKRHKLDVFTEGREAETPEGAR